METKKQKAWNCGLGLSAEEKFNKHVIKKRGCWDWSGNLVGNGYGQLSVWNNSKVKGLRAHRVAWELFFGTIPPGMNVLHKCDNPICTNPKHLWLGSQADNIADKVKKRRQAKGVTHGSKTKPDSVARREKHGMSFLTEDQILEIRMADVSVRGSKVKLARKYCVSKAQIGRIISGKSWKTI